MTPLTLRTTFGNIALLAAVVASAQSPSAPQWATIATDNAEIERLAIRLAGDTSEEALVTLRRAAENNSGDAVYALARAHALGRGVPASQDEANRLLQRGLELDHPESLLALALQAELRDDTDALFLYSRAAQLGQPLAQLRLGRANENAELGLARNAGAAAKHYQRAHENGNARATFELGRCYRDSLGVSADVTTAIRLIRQAADAGIPAAQRAMADAYAAGYGVGQDNVAAVGWLMLAAQNGNRDALVLLGSRYERGDGVLADLNQAGQFYSAAAKLGDQVARFRLAMLYAEGRGTKPDPVRGYVLLKGVRGVPPAAQALKELEASMSEEQLATARKRLAETP